MTNEEAIKVFEGINELDGISMFYRPGGKAGKLTIHTIKGACRMAVATLRAQQPPRKLDRSQWEGCANCWRWDRYDFCPVCGRPLTEEAWAELERRIGGNDGTTDLCKAPKQLEPRKTSN